MYRAPVKDLRFVLDELIGTDELRACPQFAEYSSETADAVLGEAARFAETVLEPLCKSGDREGAHWSASGVTMPEGFKAAYQQYCENGWAGLRGKVEFGGQAVPNVLGTAVEELWASSNLAFKLCPMLTLGAIEAIEHFATPAQKQLFLPKMVSGEWTGTMNLTEPQAGSDLSQIRTRAVPAGPNYRIYGQKIFITYGEHDLTDNIVHMVLARIEGAPPGVRGISLFIVPKYWVNADGSPGARNDLYCASIEHKLGIHASPTCVMMYGENEGALGLLVGEANRGLEYMFVMMNAARLSVGLEGYCAGRARVPAGRGVGAYARAGQAAGVAGKGVGFRLDGYQLFAGADHRAPGRQADVAGHEIHRGSLPGAWRCTPRTSSTSAARIRIPPCVPPPRRAAIC